MKNKVLFLCTGNYYRSKFSEIYFNFLVNKYNINGQSFSRGFYLGNKENVGWISNFAIEKLISLNVPIPEGKNPCLVTREDLNEATIIIALSEQEHRFFVRQLFPDWENKIIYWNIFDRHDISPEIALNQLQKEIELLISSLD